MHFLIAGQMYIPRYIDSSWRIFKVLTIRESQRCLSLNHTSSQTRHLSTIPQSLNHVSAVVIWEHLSPLEQEQSSLTYKVVPEVITFQLDAGEISSREKYGLRLLVSATIQTWLC